MHESCERRDGPPRRAQRIGKHGSKVVFREIADSNSFRRHAGLTNVVDGADEGMRRADLVFTIGADEHEMAALGIGHEHVQEVERGGVRPLHVVHEDDDRMRRRAKHADEFSE